MSEEKHCPRYDKCAFVRKKNFYNGVEVNWYEVNCLNCGKGCVAANISNIEFKVLEKEKGENIWKLKLEDLK